MVDKFKAMNTVMEKMGLGKSQNHDRPQRRALLDRRGGI